MKNKKGFYSQEIKILLKIAKVKIRIKKHNL